MTFLANENGYIGCENDTSESFFFFLKGINRICVLQAARYRGPTRLAEEDMIVSVRSHDGKIKGNLFNRKQCQIGVCCIMRQLNDPALNERQSEYIYVLHQQGSKV